MGFTNGDSKAMSSKNWRGRATETQPSTERNLSGSWRSSAKSTSTSPSPTPFSLRPSSSRWSMSSTSSNSSCSRSSRSNSTSSDYSSTSDSTADARPTIEQLLNERRATSPHREEASDLGIAVQRYKENELRFRYLLITQAINLRLYDETKKFWFGKTTEGQWLGYEGHATMKIDALNYIVGRMAGAGIVPPKEMITLLEQVIADRKLVSSEYSRNSQPTSSEDPGAYERHVYYFEQLEILLDGLKRIKPEAPKLGVEQILQKGSWKRN